MKLQIVCNDVFHSGPEGHPLSAASFEFDETLLEEASKNHKMSQGVTNNIFLQGPNYPGCCVLDVPQAVLDRYGLKTNKSYWNPEKGVVDPYGRPISSACEA